MMKAWWSDINNLTTTSWRRQPDDRQMKTAMQQQHKYALLGIALCTKQTSFKLRNSVSEDVLPVNPWPCSNSRTLFASQIKEARTKVDLTDHVLANMTLFTSRYISPVRYHNNCSSNSVLAFIGTRGSRTTFSLKQDLFNSNLAGGRTLECKDA